MIAVPHVTAVPSPVPSAHVAAAEVVFVDLDGTLLQTDLLWEAFFLACRKPHGLCGAFVAGVRHGRLALKSSLAAQVVPNPETLPYTQELLDWLAAQRVMGRRIVLATASPQRWADAVAEHLDVFDDVLASDETANLKSHAKLSAIREYCSRHGYESFAYVGDSRADFPIWDAASEALAVSPSRTIQKRLTKHPQWQTIGKRKSRLKGLFKALRPHQWSKNVLVFAPMVLAHAVTLTNIASALWAFLAFSLCASAVYVVNDLLDLESDRKHPTKRRRPFASASLPLSWGVPCAVGLLSLGVGLSSLFLPPLFTAILVGYLVVTSLYSFWLKRKPVVDVMLLAGLYTLRIIAGGVATATPASQWLLALSVFLFTSLAIAKRFAELSRLARDGESETQGRGYRVSDLPLLLSLGPTSGYLSVLVLALYFNSAAMKQYYTNAWALWLVCPLLLYWVTRLWFIAQRGRLHEDPVVFALKDKASWAIGASIAVLAVVATLSW